MHVMLIRANVFFHDSKQLDDTLRNGDILPYQVYSGCLRMDGQTLVNLEIFSNNADGGTSGECLLFSFLENTQAHLSIVLLKLVMLTCYVLLELQVLYTGILITV